MRSASAQLTEEAMWEREWEGFPRLGELLGGKQIPDHYFGYSSASDNAFDEIHRLMRISILVRENLDELKSPGPEPTNETEWEAQARSFDVLAQDLARLADALECVARRFHAEALEVTDARHSLTD